MKIFFDVDGVIIDGWRADPNRCKPWDLNLEADLGIHREALREALFLPGKDGTPARFTPCIIGKADLTDVLGDVLPGLGFRGPVETFLAYWFENDSNLDRAVIDVIKHLSRQDGVSLYLATNQEHLRAAHLWTVLGLEEYFDDMFHSARVGIAKQDPSYFHAVGAEVGVASDEAPLFFDDSQSVIDSARQAGWDAQLFQTVDDLLENPRLATHLADLQSRPN